MKTTVLKWVIVGSVGYYLYSKYQEGKDDGKLAGFAINPETLVDSAMPWLNLHPAIKPMAGIAAKKFLNTVVGFEKDNAIETTYRRVK